jgi:hypothetical protein
MPTLLDKRETSDSYSWLKFVSAAGLDPKNPSKSEALCNIL